MVLLCIVIHEFILISQYYLFRTSQAEDKNVLKVTTAARIPMW